jgi:hypothetical protein
MKLITIAERLGVSDSFVERCLKLDERTPELPEDYQRALGIYEVVRAAKLGVASERRAA